MGPDHGRDQTNKMLDEVVKTLHEVQLSGSSSTASRELAECIRTLELVVRHDHATVTTLVSLLERLTSGAPGVSPTQASGGASGA